jgi:hypothetical protein
MHIYFMLISVGRTSQVVLCLPQRNKTCIAGEQK